MDFRCNCFGVAAAARVPVKRYNLLVPDVFPVVEPSFDHPLGITIERKIKKLAEYLDKNEHRAPKVGAVGCCGCWRLVGLPTGGGDALRSRRDPTWQRRATDGLRSK